MLSASFLFFPCFVCVFILKGKKKKEGKGGKESNNIFSADYHVNWIFRLQSNL